MEIAVASPTKSIFDGEIEEESRVPKRNLVQPSTTSQGIRKKSNPQERADRIKTIIQQRMGVEETCNLPNNNATYQNSKAVI
jgi:hypothetical protein